MCVFGGPADVVVPLADLFGIRWGKRLDEGGSAIRRGKL